MKPPRPQWSIEIAKNMVISDGAIIAATDKFSKRDSLLIPELYKWLIGKRNLRADTTSQILLQCDKEVQFSIVKRVMYTCSKANFTDFSILVIQED